MNLQVRDPKARDLARRIALRDGISMTEAVVKALEKDLARRERGETVAETARRLQAELRALGKPGGRRMTKEQIDRMWGHPPALPGE